MLWTVAHGHALASLDMLKGTWLGSYTLDWLHPAFYGGANALAFAPESGFYVIGVTTSDLATAPYPRRRDGNDAFVNWLDLVACSDGFEPNNWKGQA